MSDLEAGHAALAKGAYTEARAAFDRARDEMESGEAYEGLAIASSGADDGTTAISAGETAYRLYIEAGDEVSAARVATLLADYYFLFRNQVQVSFAWIQRATTLLAEKPLCAEHGYLAAEAGFLVGNANHDMVAAGKYGAEAAACGRALNVPDLIMYGNATAGLAQVIMGDVDAGMALLDEASIAATAGEVRDPQIANLICCYLIYACECVHDYARAQQWCDRLRELCRTLDDDPTYMANCRTHYAGVLLWKGEWAEAEAHLLYAADVLGDEYPGLCVDAYSLLGELRRRQGKWSEAAAAWAKGEQEPRSIIGHAAMALDQGDPTEALRWTDRLLRRLPPEDRLERMLALEVALRAHLSAGDIELAPGLLEEMWGIARAVRTGAAHARALVAEGALTVARGNAPDSIPFFEDAADLFAEAGGLFDSSLARLDLGEVLLACGRPAAAASELSRAAECLEQMGAAHHAARARVLLRRAQGSHSDGGHPGRLSPREREVLALVAEGMTNAEVADRLVLSIRTVERHLATIYEKLQFEGRNARAAAVSYALREGILAG